MIVEEVWRALIMWPVPKEMGTFLTPLECAEAAAYFANLLDVAVVCFRVGGT